MQARAPIEDGPRLRNSFCPTLCEEPELGRGGEAPAVRAAVDRITSTHPWTEADENKAPLGEIPQMKHGQAVPRPPEPPEVAGDCLALDLMEFEQDPALDEFIEDHQPIAKRWTALAGEPLPLP